MKLKILLLSFILFHLNSKSQAIFQKTFGGNNEDWGTSVEQTYDGGYILGGNSQRTGAGATDMTLIKTNQLGDTLWTRTYGGLQDDICHSVKQTSDSGYILLGSTKSFGSGMDDFYLIKTNNLGDTLWTKTYGEVNSDIGWKVLQTADNGYILVGYTYNFSVTGMAIYIIKTSSTGIITWSKVLDSTFGQFAFSIDQSLNGEFIIGGGRYISNTVSDYLPLIIKIDSLGNSIWSKMYYTNGNTGFFESVKKSSNGYIASGSLFGCNSKATALLVNFDPTGSPIWSKIVPTNCYTIFSQFGYAEETFGGDFFAVGYRQIGSNSNGLIMKISNTGNVIWQNEFGGNAEDFSTYHAPTGRQTSDNGFILLGNSNSFSATGRASYLVKSDENGNVGCNSSQPTFTFTNITLMELNVGVLTPPNSTLVSSGSIQLSHISNLQSICNSCIPPVRPSAILGPNDICLADTVTYSVVLDTNAVSYTWILPSGWIGNSTTNVITVLPNQVSGNITVVSHNICATSSPQILPVTIHLNPPSQPIIISGDTSVCAGTTHLYISSIVPEATSYSWNIPSNCNDSILNEINYISFGNAGGVICLTANNSCGSSPQQCITVNMLSATTQSTFDTICQGSTFIFPDGTITNNTSTHVSVLVNTNGCDSSIISSVYVESVDTSVSQTGNTLISSVSNAIYQWINCTNGAIIGGATNQQFTTSEPGNYALIITQNNCSDTSSCHHIDSTEVSIDENSTEKFDIFPNPVSERLKLVSHQYLHFDKIILNDFLGRIINEFYSEVELDFINIPSGIYTLTFYKGSSVITKKLVVNH